MKRIKIECKTNEAWRHERAKSIGASAVGVIMGESRFMTPYELQQKMKAELRGEFDYGQTLPMIRGHAYEQGVADMFSFATGKQIIKASGAEYLVRMDDVPFMHASPDRTYWIDPEGKKNEANKGMLECKTTSRMIDAQDLPLAWVVQLQVQMGICGYKEGYIAWDQLNSWDGFGYKRFDFDQEIFDMAVKICEKFWNECIVGEMFPKPVSAKDIVSMHPNSVAGATITADSMMKSTIGAIKIANDEKKKLDELITKYKTELICLFGDEEAMVDEEGKVLLTYKTRKGSASIDSKKLKEEYPDIYQQCVKYGADTRTLLIK